MFIFFYYVAIVYHDYGTHAQITILNTSIYKCWEVSVMQRVVNRLKVA
jgi:hypothetical protein